MLLAGHQPQYLPYPGFFHKMAVADLFVVVDHIQYKKKEWQNRNRIRTNNGWIWLTVPVITSKRFFQAINTVEIRNTSRWQDKHWKSIVLNYKKTPFFATYAPKIEAVYKQEWKRLIDINMALIQVLKEALGIDTPIVVSSAYDFKEQKTSLLVEMCREVGADGYLSGAGGSDYVDETIFTRAGMTHQFDSYQCPVYQQLYAKNEEEFIANLSVLDMLFNVGKEAGSLIR